MSEPSVHQRFEREVRGSQAQRASEKPAARLRHALGWQALLGLLRGLMRLPHAPAEDRRVLEQILRQYATDGEFASLLLVGCPWYTRHYQKSYFAHHDYWTLEASESARKYGGRQHVIAPLERLDQFFPEDYFDAIVCHDVGGVGLDTGEGCEIAFSQCHSRLRDGGHLVLGWDDVPARRRIELEQLVALQRFGRLDFPGLGTWRHPTATRHRRTYDFYRKEASARAPGAIER